MRLALATLMGLLALQACEVEEASREGDPKFPLEPHYLLPQYTAANGQIAAGIVTGKTAALEQPIPFSHNIHVGMLGMDCEFCHNEARNSIHAGVPLVQMCMNCHQYVKTDNPNVQLIHEAFCGEKKCAVERDEYGKPIVSDTAQGIAWNKVHDLPDHVHFSHKRHIRGGVECTECHGQVQMQGMGEVKMMDGIPVRDVEVVMVRETTLQMGWCLNCHASHPSIDENYGSEAELRRAELKDCWTCHK